MTSPPWYWNLEQGYAVQRQWVWCWGIKIKRRVKTGYTI